MSEIVLPPRTAAHDHLDEALSVGELIDVAGYTDRVRAAADYRLLHVISRIHEHREDQYVARLAEQAPSTEAVSVAQVQSPRDKYGPNGLEQAIADVGAALCITSHRAKKLLATASAARYRLPETAYALADAIIDLDRFISAVSRTNLVSHDAIRSLDHDLARELFDRGPMSTQRFQTLIDQLIHRHDPDAVRRRAARTDDDRNIAIGTDRFTGGQARISGTLPQIQAAIIDARLDAMAKEVHTADGRTLKQRRADAYVALAQGHQHLECRCDDCRSAQVPAPAAVTTSAPSCGHPTRPYLHVVVNLSTLIGLDDDPAYLDGQGLIDADTARALLIEARRSYIHPTQPNIDAPDRRYRPSRKLRALIQAGEICCQFPGCNNPVGRSDLDHQRAFAAGGKTTRSNIGPLCRFHHRLKTFGHWQQYQDLWNTTVFTSPDGHRYAGNAYTGTDIFSAISREPSDRPPTHPTRSRFDQQREATRTKQRQAQQRWEQQHPPPF
ncbi:HNH endonuclease signature motif containing protein [Jongsikchunia kroppenstedtii]|uniref:HNH endonuclease signature motif containing protein n=1 Tax=Jongsikchunia kroppenstedtii TaxID=1121721 RepID=UPI00037E2AEA|nr:HNH endonuclease signature motif containing protein [Jongsikchunia kroppenstedtii]